MERPPPNSPSLRVLFLTDIHMDPDYATGAKVDCGDPLCCRSVDGGPVPKGAPKWGEQSTRQLIITKIYFNLAYIREIVFFKAA